MSGHSFRPTTVRGTRRCRSPATSTPTGQSRWRPTTSAISSRGRSLRLSWRPRRRSPARLDSFSKTASSYRGSTSRGIRRRFSPKTTPSWIWCQRCSAAERRRGCIAAWSTSSASRPRSRHRRGRASSGASFRSSLLRRRADRWPKSSGRLPPSWRGFSRTVRQPTSWNGAWRRPRRISCIACRPSAVSGVSRIS